MKTTRRLFASIVAVTMALSMTACGSSSKWLVIDDNMVVGCDTDAKGDVEIPDGAVSIEAYAFKECEKIETISVPDSVTYIDLNAFSMCSKLEEINVDKDNKTYCSEDGVLFSEDMTELMVYPYMHSGATYTIPDTVTTIGEGAFGAAENLENIIIPDSVKVIETGAFLYCEYIETVVIPEGVTSIGKICFMKCENLKTVVIPDSVVYIGDKAFDDCPNITVTYQGKTYTQNTVNEIYTQED